MKILGIDCGTAITGWAVLEYKSEKLRKNHNTNNLKLLECGTITTHKFTPEFDRLLELGESIEKLIKEFKPIEMAIEDIFYFKNAKTVIKVSQARGVVIFQAMKEGVRCIGYTPLQIKKGITGYGRAEKNQVMFMLNKIFNLKGKLKQDDAADALAVAYCHYLNL